MDHRDRLKIDTCVNAIMKILDMTILWPFLLKNEIYKKDDVNVPVWEQSLNETKTMEDILLTIKTRGPNAYQNLLKSLREANYIDIVDMLEIPLSSLANNNSNEEIHQRQCGYDRIKYDPSQAKEPIKVVVRKASKFYDTRENQIISTYPMKSKIRGLVLIITLINYVGNSHRQAAEYDERNLKDLFEQMGFIVFAFRDLNVAQIRDEMKKFANNRRFNQADSCFVIISAHGDRSSFLESQTVIVDIHNNEITVGEILSYFSAERCSVLINKPKVFIFQLCRGKLEQKSVDVGGKNLNKNSEFNFQFDHEERNASREHFPKEETTRNYADIIVAHSTLPGYVSFRDNKNGSWYIQLLCETFMEHAHNNHVHDLFLMVDSRLKQLRNTAKNCQTSTVKTIGFNKHLYINPGLYDGDNM